jgi:Transposase DDE domain
MSSKNSLSQLSVFVTKKIPQSIPKKLHSLYLFGIKCFTVQPMVSCNGNARIAHGGSRHAAEQQMYRLLRHPKLFLLVWRSVAIHMPLCKSDRVNVDYSNLGPLAILGFAKQTKQGRALPILMRSLASNTQGQKKAHPNYQRLKDSYARWKKTVQADQFTFVIKSLKLLKYLYHCQPRLVFDRGFVHQELVRYLCDEKWVFYIRMRDDFYVLIGGTKHKVSDLPVGEHTVTWADRTLRLIVTKPRKRYTTPWCIITNDRDTCTTKVTKYYYYRFEIEESFRDLKSIYHLKYTRVRTWRSLRVILCFMSLALILALHDRRICDARAEGNYHPKKTLSLVRMWQELIQHAELALFTRKLKLRIVQPCPKTMTALGAIV